MKKKTLDHQCMGSCKRDKEIKRKRRKKKTISGRFVQEPKKKRPFRREEEVVFVHISGSHEF